MLAGENNPKVEVVRNISDFNSTSNNSDKVILTLESSDNTNLDFYLSEIVSGHCEISDKTFRNWRRKLEPTSDQVKTENGNKKLFRIDYLKKVFDLSGNKEARQKLETINEARENLDKIPGNSGQIPEEITNLELVLENLKSKDQIIESKDQTIEILQNQIDRTWAETYRTQKELFETRQELENTKNQLKLTQNQHPKWITWLLAFFNQNKKN